MYIYTCTSRIYNTLVQCTCTSTSRIYNTLVQCTCTSTHVPVGYTTRLYNVHLPVGYTTRLYSVHAHPCTCSHVHMHTFAHPQTCTCASALFCKLCTVVWIASFYHISV